MADCFILSTNKAIREENQEYMLNKSNVALGLMTNVFSPSSYCFAGYPANPDSWVTSTDRFLISKWEPRSPGYTLSHTNKIDLTNIKKIIISGTIRSNLSGLSATGYCYISSEVNSVLDENTNNIITTADYDPIDFVKEIDCSNITGEYYIYLGIKHGG